MFASNDGVTPVPVEKSDRRYTVFSNHDAITDEYRDLVQSCFKVDDNNAYDPKFAEEISGFWDYLLKLPVDTKLLKKPYNGDARERLKSASASAHEQFIAAVLDGQLDRLLEAATARDPVRIGKPETWDFGDAIATRVLYACYVEFCRQSGCKYPYGEAKFGSALHNRSEPWAKVTRMRGGKRTTCYVIPGRAAGNEQQEKE
jgi:hypothetical protein